MRLEKSVEMYIQPEPWPAMNQPAQAPYTDHWFRSAKYVMA